MERKHETYTKEPVSRNQDENILPPAEILVHVNSNEIGLEIVEFEIGINEAGLGSADFFEINEMDLQAIELRRDGSRSC